MSTHEIVGLSKLRPERIDNPRIDVVELCADYLPKRRNKVLMRDGTDAVTVEVFVTRYYERLGFHVLSTENAPFRVLFATFMSALIQDPTDRHVRAVRFGRRDPALNGEQTLPALISTRLPDDFGTVNYGRRRRAAIDKHLSRLRACGTAGVEHLFDDGLAASEELRQYLWAHRRGDIAAARELVRRLSRATLYRVLRYLAGDYWRRSSGWPDLVVCNSRRFFLAEVKSHLDRLSTGQTRWLEANTDYLRLPFKLVNVSPTAS